jgi:nucleoid-associated protein YgaU
MATGTAADTTKEKCTIYPRQRRFVTIHGPKIMPAVLRRVLSALIVLAIGGLAAAPFYRPSSQPPFPQPAPATGPTGSIPMADSSPDAPGATVEPGSPANSPTPPLVDSVTFQPGDRLKSELRLTRRAPSAEARVPPADPIDPRRTDRAVDSITESDPADLVWRTHRIVDGDTLEKLARRLLGDPTRWPEIQTANADILTEDGVLPIGKILRIPPREAPAASDLVPIPWLNQKTDQPSAT